MDLVENDTDEDVEYAIEEGEGTHSFTRRIPLARGERKELQIVDQVFDIYFYRIGETDEPIAVRKRIFRDSHVRLYAPDSGRIAVDTRPAKAA